jgi:hypothetical protein
MATNLHVTVSFPFPQGFGHSILQCKEWAGSDPFLVLLGDHVYLSSHPSAASTNCARQLVDCYAHFGSNGSGAMVTALTEVESEDFDAVALVHGSAIHGVDLYAHHTELQKRIAAQHAQHGLDLAAIQLQAEGVSRFTRSPTSPPPPEPIQGDLYRLTKLVEKPSEAQAHAFKLARAPTQPAAIGYPDFAAAARSPTGSAQQPSHEFLACLGIDLLGPAIFPVLEMMLAEIEAESHAEDDTDTNAASSSAPAPAPAPARRELQLRDAMGLIMTSGTMIGLKILGQRFDTGQPLLYARAMQAFVAEAAERAQTKQDADMLIEAPQGKLGVIGAPDRGVTTPAAAQPAPSPVAVKLSNAALPKRAVYD